MKFSSKAKYKKIFLTGGAGALGSHLLRNMKELEVFAPDIETLNIYDRGAVNSFFTENDFDAIIHCAAMARLSECDTNPLGAIESNIIGTANLVMEAMKKEKQVGKNIRFIHISTDGVYPGIKGKYSEEDATIPYTKYGWTKLGAETSVRLLPDFCIIRTRFFDPKNISFSESATDIFTSKIPISELVDSILYLLQSRFIGVINIGGKRISDFEMNRLYKPDIKPCLAADILKDVSFKLHKDIAMDVSLWEKIKKQ